MNKPLVAIVGRPNVGKSALLNRLIQKREAIVENTPGVTRDRIYRDTSWNSREFTLIDTGGILIHDPDSLKKSIRMQVEVALEEADLILFVVDIREGLHVLDEDVADMLRKTNKEIIVVANKADSVEKFPHAGDFYSLGFGQPMPVSSMHGVGTGDLMDLIAAKLPEKKITKNEIEPIKITIVGRPNVGKSSILNAILGQERSIVTPTAGTTRDIVDSYFEWGGAPFTIVDTAGLRRKSKVTDNIEYYSTTRASQALKRSDIGLMVMDATELAVMQDLRIAGMLDEEGKGVILIINKWDKLFPDFKSEESRQKQLDVVELLKSKMDFMSYAPIIFTSAVQNKGIKKIFPQILQIQAERMKKIDTSLLNQLFQDAFFMRPPPSYKGKNLKLYYVHQAGVAPPRFVFKVNSHKLVHFSYKRYLENQLRNAVPFRGTPVKLIFKS
ncbi:MAG: ribosome biogenesis GTPase Der [Vulcanimicrobiota bacterium]